MGALAPETNLLARRRTAGSPFSTAAGRLHFFALLAIVLIFAPALNAAAGEGKVEFNRDIRPILSDKCFKCHGPDEKNRKAKLRLDDRRVALQKGAIVPGKPAESELVRRIFTSDPDDLMPPPKSLKTLTAAQKETLKNWIAQGAEYALHWAYIAPRRPNVPTIKNTGWARNAIDAFILQPLEARGIQPSAEADRRTLLRRLKLDLLGLPPTPAEVREFLADHSPDAYEKEVNRFLASPHFGERMAVPWLDTVRYADTVGYHGDQNQNIFPYRDYVIDSFNENKPFDEFTIEQLAGDLLPESVSTSGNPSASRARDERLIATGFNRLNMVTREGGAQPKEYLAKYAADRVRTVATTWLGSTMACCECHDHKFDPFTTRDFYSLAAFFADVKQWGVYNDYKYTPNPDLKGWSNDHPFPPELEVASDYLAQRRSRLQQKIATLVSATAARAERNASARGAFAKWRKESAAFLKQFPSGWAVLIPKVDLAPAPTKPRLRKRAKPAAPAAKAAAQESTKPAPEIAVEEKAGESEEEESAEKQEKGKTNAPAKIEFFLEPDKSILITNAAATNNLRLILEPPPGWLAAVRLELIPHEKLQGGFLRGGAKNGTLKLGATLQRNAQTNEIKIAFRHADASLKEPRYANGSEIIGITEAWKTSAQNWRTPHVGVWLLDAPVRISKGDRLILKLGETTVGSFRVSTSPFAPLNFLDSDWSASLRVALASPNPGSIPGASLLSPRAWQSGASPLLHEIHLASTAWEPKAFASYKSLQADLLQCRHGRAMTLVTAATNPLTMRVLPRGNWQDETGPIVTPAPPQFLPQPANSEGRRLTRLDLARWLIAPENPLTARVFVNRLWKQFFGAGLCNTVDDFGAQGDPPSHPELLDWLATEFMQPTDVPATRPTGTAPHSWDIKHIARLIVTSASYRQASNLRPELRDIDPQNRLLASQSPRRLDAEFVRDNALFISGLINLDLGGPSAFPYQPAGYYANLQFPDRTYAPERDERQYRRGVYMHWQRTFLHPMLANFDAPSREECAAARLVSNTPQQALTLLNDPTFVEAAAALAEKILTTPALNEDERLNALFESALARQIKPKERDSLKSFLTDQRAYYSANPAESKKLIHTGLFSPRVEIDQNELASWTSVCRVVLNLHEVITRY